MQRLRATKEETMDRNNRRRLGNAGNSSETTKSDIAKARSVHSYTVLCNNRQRVTDNKMSLGDIEKELLDVIWSQY